MLNLYWVGKRHDAPEAAKCQRKALILLVISNDNRSDSHPVSALSKALLRQTGDVSGARCQRFVAVPGSRLLERVLRGGENQLTA
jgi:hypothetical protein